MYRHLIWLISFIVLGCDLKKPIDVEPILFTFTTGDNFAPARVDFSSELQDIRDYSWDFGDGSAKSTEATPSHIYSENGNYTVTLSATRTNGESKTFISNVEIKSITFEKFYGTGYDEVGKSVMKLPDGGYLLCGETEKGDWGQQDILVIKLDRFGKEIESKHFGTSENDYAYSMIKTAENDFVICGMTANVSDRQVLVLCINAELKLIWQKVHGDPAKVELGKGICQLSNGEFVICGQMNTDANENSANTYTLKIDKNGDKIVENGLYGSINTYDIAHDILATTDGYLILTGQTDYPAGNNQAFWSRRFVGLTEKDAYFFGGNQDEIGLSIKETSDGGFVFCGFTASIGQGKHDIWVIKTDKNGQKIWDKSYGDSEDDDAWSIQIIQNIDNIDYLTGGASFRKIKGDYDAFFLGLDNNSDITLEKYFGGAQGEVFYNVQQGADGGFIGCGFTQSYGSGKKDIYLVKTDRNGNL